MHTAVTSRASILQTCRTLVSEHGLSALQMRTVARQCNVALGSLYHYFPSKDDLMIAAIESVWQDIFHTEQPCEAKLSFLAEVQGIFTRVKTGMLSYPNFFTAHSIYFASESKGHAHQTMARYFVHMKNSLLETLQRDVAVRQHVFDDAFTASAFVDLILSSLLSLLMQCKPSCDVLLEVIRRTLYEAPPAR